jgi:hypothetical protein
VDVAGHVQIEILNGNHLGESGSDEHVINTSIGKICANSSLAIVGQHESSPERSSENSGSLSIPG